MTIGTRVAMAAALIATASLSVSPTQAAEPDKIVEAFTAVFGKQKARLSGAKGECVMGQFTPTAEAKSLTRSVNFDKPAPVLGRFSMGGGNPKIADAAKAAVRGFSFKIDPGGKQSTEFAMVSAPMFFAKTPAQLHGFLEARIPGADGKPDGDKVKAFTAANPETTRQGQWLASKPVPASFAGVGYWGIHAYTLTNAAGAAQVVKFKLVPIGGDAGLTDDEAKAKPADFLVAELSERLAKKTPTGFDVLAILGQASDPTNDPTMMWTDEDKRPTVKLGTIVITAIEKNESCDAGYFDPTNIADGIAGPKNDPMFLVRKPVYGLSATQRAK